MKLPFKYRGIDFSVDRSKIIFNNVKFTEAFGEFELGSEWDGVFLDLETSSLKAYDVSGKLDCEQKCALKAT